MRTGLSPCTDNSPGREPADLISTCPAEAPPTGRFTFPWLGSAAAPEPGDEDQEDDGLQRRAQSRNQAARPVLETTSKKLILI
jgi:hypothetical protein